MKERNKLIVEKIYYVGEVSFGLYSILLIADTLAILLNSSSIPSHSLYGCRNKNEIKCHSGQ